MEAVVHDAVFDMRLAREQLEAALDGIGDGEWDRYVPYGDRTLYDLLAHVAAADQAWAVAARDLLKGEGAARAPRVPSRARASARRATVAELRSDMVRRRQLLLALFELLEARHLSLRLAAFGTEHNSVRERIWLGYHDRLHADDIARARRLRWHPRDLRFLPQIAPAVAGLQPGPTLHLVYSVDPAWWERPTRDHPDWTYRQTLAHIATGDWVSQGHLRHIIDKGSVAAWPDVAAGNERLLAERRFSTHSALIEEYLSMRHETFVLLSQLQPAHLALPIELWWRPEPREATVLDYILAFPEHERAHSAQLRPAMRHATNPR
jgi:hypothetical protein